MTIDQAFQVAFDYHRSERFAEAEGIYRKILAMEPDSADAMHFLGVAAYQSGRSNVAVEWIGKAIQRNPNCADLLLQLWRGSQESRTTGAGDRRLPRRHPTPTWLGRRALESCHCLVVDW